MATILQQYRDMQSNLKSQITTIHFPINQILVLQELNYRICVLETFETYCKTAPVTSDVNEIAFHYQLVDAYVRGTLTERRFGLRGDDEVKKRRETATTSFERVVQDGRKRFVSFAVGAPSEQYKNDINNYIKTILPVWLQYRNCYINIASK